MCLRKNSYLPVGLNFRAMAELEKSMVGVERIRQYQNTPIEAPFDIPEYDSMPSWPEHGVVEFDNYQTRYRDGLDLVLKGIIKKIMKDQ